MNEQKPKQRPTLADKLAAWERLRREVRERVQADEAVVVEKRERGDAA